MDRSHNDVARQLIAERPLLEFTKIQMLKIWKGMFYCMFLCDKALVQVELRI